MLLMLPLQAEAERAALLQQMAQLTQTKSAAAPQTDTKANAQVSKTSRDYN